MSFRKDKTFLIDCKLCEGVYIQTSLRRIAKGCFVVPPGLEPGTP